MVFAPLNLEDKSSAARLAGSSCVEELAGNRFRGANPGPAAPGSPSEVAVALSNYLAHKFDCPRLEFAKPPGELCGGWETYTYSFHLQPQPALPQAYRTPLIARIYSCNDGLARARHEFVVQRRMAGLGYPVASPLLLEESGEYFGGPFLLSPEVPGQVLLHSLLHRPWAFDTLAERMAAAHALLHQLPMQDFPDACVCFLSQTLEEMTHIVRRYDLTRLWPGLDWLWTNRPSSPQRRSILHLDFHPLNLLETPTGDLVVIDWPESAVGDPHADLGNTLLTLECHSDGASTWLDHLFMATGRKLFMAAYLDAYREQLPVDDELLSYYRAWATLRRLCLYAQWFKVGPTMNGRKPSAIQQVQPDHLHTLEQYFRKWTKVRIALD